jgi:hypothetical protein
VMGDGFNGRSSHISKYTNGRVKGTGEKSGLSSYKQQWPTRQSTRQSTNCAGNCAGNRARNPAGEPKREPVWFAAWRDWSEFALGGLCDSKPRSGQISSTFKLPTHQTKL